MTAGIYHIHIEQGADLNLTFTVKDSTGSAVNFSGYSAVRSKFKRKFTDNSALIEANNTNSRLTFGGTTGTIVMAIPASVTSGLTVSEGIYDIETVDGSGGVNRVLQGSFEVSPEVTN